MMHVPGDAIITFDRERSCGPRCNATDMPSGIRAFRQVGDDEVARREALDIILRPTELGAGKPVRIDPGPAVAAATRGSQRQRRSPPPGDSTDYADADCV
jgi:hypothetical protein